MELHEKENRAVELALALRKYVSIASHVSGRVRLKASMGILRSPALKALTQHKEADVNQSVQRIRGVIDSRLNLVARSLVVQYDPRLIEPADLREFFETKEDSVAKALLEKYMRKQN